MPVSDFDYVEEAGQVWRYVDRLEDEQRERALARVAQSEAAWRRRHGLPPVTRPDSRLMRCGHLHQCVRVDENGAEICTACEWADQEARRG
jgi:hypothetical protein